jgi:hypothetical protein
LPGIETGISSHLFGILERIKVEEFSQEGMGGLLTDTGNAEEQLLFPAQIIILINLRLDELLNLLDLVIQIADMFFQNAGDTAERMPLLRRLISA